MKNARAQAWGFDLMVAGMIFIAGIVVFYIYSINYPTEGQETLDVLFYEGNFIVDTLLTEGHPDNWQEGDVVRIGLINDEKVNQTKIERLYNMTNETVSPGGYAVTKALFNTRFEYFMNFSTQMTIAGNDVEGIGRIPINPDNVIKVSRFTVYEDRPVTINVIIWE